MVFNSDIVRIPEKNYFFSLYLAIVGQIGGSKNPVILYGSLEKKISGYVALGITE